MSDNNNNKTSNGLKNSNNSETLYNVIQNKRQTSRNYGTNNVSNNKQFNLNLDETTNNTSVFNLNRTGSPCLPNFGSLNKDSMFNSKYQDNDYSLNKIINDNMINDNNDATPFDKKKKNSVTEIIEGNLLVQHEWPTDEDDDSDVQSKCATPGTTVKFNTKPMLLKPNEKKKWINIDYNHLSGINDTHSHTNSTLRLNTSMPLDESDTLSDYNSAGYEADESKSNLIKNNLNYLNQNKEVLYNKYSNINKREDKRIKLGMGFSTYRKKLKTCEYQSKQEYLKDELKYKKSRMFSMSIAKKSCNFKRNRYSDISPFNYNRVLLKVGEESNDYINASKVILDSIDPKNPEVLIATQGPTKNTYPQFWQMVYDQCLESKVREIIIVMVTPLVENGREKCFPYWPSRTNHELIHIPQTQSVGQSTSVFSQDLKLRVMEGEQQVGSHYYTILELEDESHNKVKVHHLYYDKWEDFSSPTSISQVIDLIKHTNALRKDNEMKVISHCSAGVGRTGTFFALYYLYNSFMNKSLSVSGLSDPVESTVSQLRKCRMKMVQTFEQYKFIYEVVRQLYENDGK